MPAFDNFSMLSKGFAISRTFWSTAVVALVLPGCTGSSLLGQIGPAPSTQAQPTIPSTAHDPTYPEVQPRLDVTHDPIPSPDVEDSAPVSTALPLPPARSGEIQ